MNTLTIWQHTKVRLSNASLMNLIANVLKSTTSSLSFHKFKFWRISHVLVLFSHVLDLFSYVQQKRRLQCSGNKIIVILVPTTFTSYENLVMQYIPLYIYFSSHITRKRKILPKTEFYKITLYFKYIYIWIQIDKHYQNEYMYMTFLFPVHTIW